MRRSIGLVVLCLVAASIFATRYSARNTALRVNESSTRFSLQKEGTIVSIALENPSATKISEQIKLELLNPRDVIRARTDTEIPISLNVSVSKIPLTKVGIADYKLNELLWHRLRYRIELKDAKALAGIISLSEIAPGIFRLLVLALEEVGKEAKYSIRTRTLHPLTGAPVSAVKIEAEMIYQEGDQEHKLKTSGITNAFGEALVHFGLPEPLKTDEANLKVTAERNGFFQEAMEEIDFLHPNQILVSTDKPIYPPGQTLHTRVLAFDRDRRAWADSNYLFGQPVKRGRVRVVRETQRYWDFRNQEWKIEEGEKYV